MVVGCEYTDIDDVEDAHDVVNQMTNLEKKVYINIYYNYYHHYYMYYFLFYCYYYYDEALTCL